MKDLKLLVTLWPTFPHFEEYSNDTRLCGVRLNSAMVKVGDLGNLLQDAKNFNCRAPLYFDVKGKQLRVVEDHSDEDHLEVVINHPIEVKTPIPVLFKAGEDGAILKEVKDQTRLIFEGGPKYVVFPNESLHIRDPNLRVYGPTFLEDEIAKIEKAKQAGFDKFFLSYVQSQRDVDEFREYVGKAEVVLKIEDEKGLRYVANEYRKQENTWLLAARGDLFVEVERPHQVTEALKLIIDRDPEAGVGSRILLSLIAKEYFNVVDSNGELQLGRDGKAMINHKIILNPVPSCADISDITWLYDIGYRKMMLCDEICLDGNLLGTAINVLGELSRDYGRGIQFNQAASQGRSPGLEETHAKGLGRLRKTNSELYKRNVSDNYGVRK